MPVEGLAMLLRSFRLPTMAAIWEESVSRAERENWGYQRLLQYLCESEAQDRRERKVERLLQESGLPEGKTLGNLDEQLLPVKIRRLAPTLLEGHFVGRAENLLAFGLPGRGKTHFLAALGRELYCGTAIRCFSRQPSNWCSSCWPPRRNCAWKRN